MPLGIKEPLEQERLLRKRDEQLENKRLPKRNGRSFQKQVLSVGAV